MSKKFLQTSALIFGLSAIGLTLVPQAGRSGTCLCDFELLEWGKGHVPWEGRCASIKPGPTTPLSSLKCRPDTDFEDDLGCKCEISDESYDDKFACFGYEGACEVVEGWLRRRFHDIRITNIKYKE